HCVNTPTEVYLKCHLEESTFEAFYTFCIAKPEETQRITMSQMNVAEISFIGEDVAAGNVRVLVNAFGIKAYTLEKMQMLFAAGWNEIEALSVKNKASCVIKITLR